MKAPRFWYPAPPTEWTDLQGALLEPLAAGFRLGTRLRRAFTHPYTSHIPVICVGNAVVGGAGKTPTALALARLLREEDEKPAFVTRGYGGDGQIRWLDPYKHTAKDVGDEAMLLSAEAPTWVGPDRAAAIRQAERHATCIVMDDGLQNPHVAPSSSLLVVDGEVGIGNGRVLPAGPLREPFEDAVKKATVLIIIGPDRQKIAARVKIPVLNAHLEPHLPAGFPKQSRFVAFAGIARPAKFYATAQKAGCRVLETVDFPDHHVFSSDDIDFLRLSAERLGARLLTTEKDAVRLPQPFRDEVLTLPVRLVFDTPGAKEKLVDLLQKNYREKAVLPRIR